MNARQLGTDFSRRYGVAPEYAITAPGRVNLIGEHTDYNGLPVLPVSIPFAIRAVVSARTDTTVVIANINPSYAEDRFDLTPEIHHSPQGYWTNYVKAAVLTLMNQSGGQLRGFNALFHGDIPPSAGLSSSSAMVIASALALKAVNNIEIDSLELAELMADGERYVGTQGGGMDQAICLLGKEGCALKLDFFPLRFEYVPFPPSHSIIVAHSLIKASKTKSTMYKFNTRSAECRLATAAINAIFKLSLPLERLGDITGRDFFRSYNSPADFVNETFTRDSYTPGDIAGITGDTESSLTEKYLLGRYGDPLPIPSGGFRLRKRTLHILMEAERVEESRQILHDNDPEGFGELMNASHKSCSELYEISTPELDELTRIMRQSGALGARLTGAGFGGCAIALVHDDRCEKIMDNVKKFYYTTYMAEKHPGIVRVTKPDERMMFAVKPAQGAHVTAI